MDTDRSDPRIGRVQIGNTRVGVAVACPFILSSIPFIPLARL